ncbi:hypothetical protein QE152_g9983 [Popillia japonica]|uniref:C2H2-type domain-containing protein n=1 Tax=Popillia japonica TaxID=7064 RepID=A0AAW1LSW8_POPJA
MDAQIDTPPDKVKQEIDGEIDLVEPYIAPLKIKIEPEEDEQYSKHKFEFVALDPPVDASDTSNNSHPQIKKPQIQTETSQTLTESFEEVTIKEEVEFTITYCEMCNMKFNKEEDFEEHCTLHNKRSTYFCSVCLEIFKTKRSIEKHFVTHREISVLSKCNLCNYTFASREDLNMHSKRIEKYRCSVNVIYAIILSLREKT